MAGADRPDGDGIPWLGGSFRRLAWSMAGFGLVIGVSFPPAMRITDMMTGTEASNVPFRGACLLAGVLVGGLNFTLVKIVVGRRLRSLAAQMGKAVELISVFQTERDWTRLETLGSRIPVDSGDELGQPAAAFNTLLVAMEKNASVQRELESKLRFQAFHDPLTGLANRALFLDRTANALARVDRSEPDLALLYLDVDKFKPVNDEFGHRVGDHVLTEVALRLKSCFRAGDTVARLGGDEFAVLTENATELDIDWLVNRLTEILAQPMVIDGHSLHISVSIGVARYEHRDLTPDQLIHAADVAMYEHKTATWTAAAVAGDHPVPAGKAPAS